MAKMLVHLELSDQRPNEWVLWCLHHQLKNSISHSADSTCLSAVSRVWKGLSFENEWLIQWEWDCKSFALLSYFVLNQCGIGFSNCSKGILMIKIIYIFVKLRMFPLWMPDVRRRSFIGLYPNTDLSCLGPMKAPTTSQLGEVSREVSKTWHQPGGHPVTQTRRTLSLTLSSRLE